MLHIMSMFNHMLLQYLQLHYARECCWKGCVSCGHACYKLSV